MPDCVVFGTGFSGGGAGWLINLVRGGWISASGYFEGISITKQSLGFQAKGLGRVLRI
jgi:hypothetical protein